MPEATVPLGQLASARSGDKGNHANIGVVARDAEDFAFLCQQLTATRVADYFQGLGATRVERFELPEVWALNFVLYNALRGGASQSLHIDTQGKLLGTAILELELPVGVDSDPVSVGRRETDSSLWIRETEDGTVD
ncbi:MAG: hypothetical protein QF918_04740 [Pirellulaceae bacterium]|jgi:hypothetical protein|nr:hypothetical protein [Pirellulaceae bacterium]MDP6553352.1 hypothetical protein [Pirellulaceae bacterium]MDP6721308.1 hypothetical protein [Pirellulaceae bacterium]